MKIHPDAYGVTQQNRLNASEAMISGGLIGAGLSILVASLGYALYSGSTQWTYMTREQWKELCGPTQKNLDDIYFGRIN